MQVLLCIISILFGGLQLIASISQLKNEKKPLPAVIMLIGSLMVIAAVVCNISAQWYDYIIALFGCIAICIAAIWNGVKSKQLHIQHHVIRIALSFILIIGFILL